MALATVVTGLIPGTAPNGKTGRAFRRSLWTPILKQLGIRYHRSYNMPHSYATAMLMAGMTPAFARNNSRSASRCSWQRTRNGWMVSRTL